MARYFTVDEAERLLPTLERELKLAMRTQQELAGVTSELQQYSDRISMLGGVLPDREKAAAIQSRRNDLTGQPTAAIEAVQREGCQIKDLSTGLLDFPTIYRGEEVLLCWKLGESGISHWHGLTEGFRGRKPIDEEFLANHRGGDAG
ncbi:MAG: DUF2203 domain-containing protein [bacterium]|nr:DUF2203 domain-containing protein [bacterium]